MSRTYLGRWIDRSIGLYSPGVPDPNNGVDETDLEVEFQDVLTVEQLASHLRLDVNDLRVGEEANVRLPVWYGDTFLGQFVGYRRNGAFRPVQAAIDLARERIGE